MISLYQHLSIEELKDSKNSLSKKLDSLPTRGSIIEKSDLAARIKMIDRVLNKRYSSTNS